MARLYEDIERNVADAGVYQHLNDIATGRLFFPQKVLGSSVGLRGARYELRDPLPAARRPRTLLFTFIISDTPHKKRCCVGLNEFLLVLCRNLHKAGLFDHTLIAVAQSSLAYRHFGQSLSTLCRLE